MPTTCAKSSKNIMTSKNIGKEEYLQTLTWNGIIPPSTMTTYAASQSKYILKYYLYDSTTRAQTNIRSCPTSIVKFTMEPKYKWPQRKWIAQVLMLKAQNAFKIYREH